MPKVVHCSSIIPFCIYTISKSDTNTITLYPHTLTTKALMSQCMEKVHPLLFWVAMGVLPAQASALHRCWTGFSSSKATCMLHWNRISPQPLEALQILKFTLRKDRLNITGDLLAQEEDYNVIELGEQSKSSLVKARRSWWAGTLCCFRPITNY